MKHPAPIRITRPQRAARRRPASAAARRASPPSRVFAAPLCAPVLELFP